MTSEAAAVRAAEAELAKWQSSGTPDDEVVVWRVEEHALAWVVHFASRQWLRTRDFRDQLIGACPFVVDKATGELHVYGSGPDGYLQFTAWLDDEEH